MSIRVMNLPAEQDRVLVMFSGGLDSTIIACLLGHFKL